MNTGLRQGTACALFVMLGMLFVLPAGAEGPSNAELFQMILELNVKMATVQANAAEARARKAEKALRQTQDELAVAREQLEAGGGAVETAGVSGRMGPGSAPVPWTSADQTGNIYASLEAIFLRPSTNQLHYATVDNLAANSVGSGGVQEVEYDYEAGLRAALGYRFPNTGVNVILRYTGLDANASDSVMVPAGSHTLRPTLWHPAGRDNADAASATSQIELDVLDIEAGYNFVVGDTLDMRTFGGLRYASLDQTFDVIYTGDEFSTGISNSSVDMSVYGVRGGFEGIWEAGHGFSIFGMGAASLLAGEIEADLRQNDVGGDGLLVDISRNLSVIVPVLEAAIGAGWEWDSENGWVFRLRGGYEFQNWFNVVEVIEFVDDGSDGRLVDNASDLGFDGFFARVEVTF